MAFLDFIKDRQQPAGPSQNQKPEASQPQTAREMYAQRDAQEKANQKPLTPEVKSQADQVMEAVGRHQFQEHGRAQSAPSDQTSHSEPMRQNAVNQDKEAHALSPTTEQVGKVAEKSPSTPDNEPQSGRHNRATPDDIVASERGKSTSPEPANGKEQASPQKPQQKERGGWER